MKKRILLAAFLAAVLAVMPACSATAPESASSTPQASAESSVSESAGGSEPSEASATEPSGFSGTVTFGVVAPMSGTNTMVGDYVVNGANMAAEHINANGGILGKELKLVFEDEVDNLQASVNAMTKIAKTGWRIPTYL